MEQGQDKKQRLEAYLRAKFPQREGLSVTKIDQLTAGMSRENHAVTLSWREAQGQVSESLIIQVELGFARDEEYDFRPQYEVLKAVHGTGIPVPRVYWLEMDSSVLGHPFSVMEKIEGEVLGEGYYTYHPEHLEQLGKDYAGILAKIHGLDWQALGLHSLGMREVHLEDFDLDMARYSEQIAEANRYNPQPVMAEFITWLRRNRPPAERTTLCHGDYHLRNFLARDGRIVAVLDWEAAHIGDPMYDLGWSCMLMKAVFVDFWNETDFIRTYEEMAEVKVNKESLLFWKVAASVILAYVGLVGIKSGIESKDPDMRQLWIWHILVPRVQDIAARMVGF